MSRPWGTTFSFTLTTATSGIVASVQIPPYTRITSGIVYANNAAVGSSTLALAVGASRDPTAGGMAVARAFWPASTVQQNGRGAVLLRAVANGSTLIPFGCDVTTDEQPRFIIADATNSTANDVTYTVTVYGIQEDTPGTPRASKLQSFPSEATGATTGFGTPPPVATSAVDAVQSA